MRLDEYFDFLGRDSIRVRGTRVGIETILDDYLSGASPEEIAARYRTLTLEQVYAAITYYLRNRPEMDAYLQRWRSSTDESAREADPGSAEFSKMLRERMERARESLVKEKGPFYLTSRQQ